MTLLYIIAGVVVAAVFIVSWLLSSLVVRPKVNSYEACFDYAEKNNRLDRPLFDSYPKEKFTLRSEYGYNLACVLIPKREDAPTFSDGKERVVVIVHGYTSSMIGSGMYTEMFRRLGFNCLLYDHRNHGGSDKAPTTMGYCESRDLCTVIAWARKRFTEDCVIGTHGESMGAATVMMHAPMDDKLAFVIEDCGYSVLCDQLAYNMRAIYHLPRQPFLAIASLFSKLRGGIWFSQVVPKNEVAKCDKLPMLFIHGESDMFVPSYMVNEVYNAKPGPKMKKTFPGAAHACSYPSDSRAYIDAVDEFLAKYKII